MTVLHSSNADVADVSDLDEAPAQDGTTETDPRADLGKYADLGAFTLSADTHAWYEAVDTVATPEDARAASTVLAELRGRDLQQTWESVAGLATDAGLEEPGTVAKAALLVELLQRVHRTSTTLDGAAYESDLDALTAATAGGAWRRERGVRLSWLRARALRKQAQTLATGRLRREELHEALAAAEVERRAWAVFAPEGARPVPPADGALVEATAQAFEAINAGLAELARLLPARDLDTLTFEELTGLVERLADDEGTLYRLPTIRTLRATLEENGLAELLTELTAARADRRAADAAYQRHIGGADAARQALAGGQRDGQAETAVETQTETVAETAAEEVEVEVDVADVEAPAAVATEAAIVIPAPASEDAALVVEVAEVEVTEVEVSEVEVAEAEAEVAEPEAVEAVEVVEVEAAEVEVAQVEVAEAEAEVAEPEAVDVEAAEADAEVEVAEVEAAEAEVAEVEVVELAAVGTEVVEVEADTVEADVEVESVELALVEAAVEVEAVETESAAVEVVEVAPAVEVVEVAEAAAPVDESAKAATRTRRPKKPDFTPGKPVTAYSAAELLAVVRWIDGDAVERTDEELLRAAMKEFGFARLGPRIKEALGTAVSEARS
ncbi:hypothetical protein [Kitasatospora sp. NPDC057015]|uniref:hypothetical protein n=1 Tax=Kitasatospora sp. NPDC057015 TaxID=3346001 RepID=UPI0036253730